MAVALNMLIFIIDGYKSMLRVIQNLSKQNGFANLGAASDGVFGLKMLPKKEYDLLISDWNMQPMAGIELCKEMRSDEIVRSIPLVMVIAVGKAKDLIMAKKSWCQ
ncbi:MAG: response regulator [Alphaproteobacteria bacterium]